MKFTGGTYEFKGFSLLSEEAAVYGGSCPHPCYVPYLLLNAAVASLS